MCSEKKRVYKENYWISTIKEVDYTTEEPIFWALLEC